MCVMRRYVICRLFYDYSVSLILLYLIGQSRNVDFLTTPYLEQTKLFNSSRETTIWTFDVHVMRSGTLTLKQICVLVHQAKNVFESEGITKHLLITGPTGNSEFCFSLIQHSLGVLGKQNSLFPGLGTIILKDKCLLNVM